MLLYGKPVADQLKTEQAQRITQAGRAPRLDIIQAGDDLASSIYITMKERYGEQIGSTVARHQVSGDIQTLTDLIMSLNQNPNCHGIIVQLPIPDQTITEQVLTLIDPAKDVDGLGPNSPFKSATAMAVIQLMKFYKIPLNGPITLVGQGRLVGTPLKSILTSLGATLTICDKDTPLPDLAAATQAAKVIISATGIGGLITPDMVSTGSTVIDVGTGEDGGSLVGDVDPALLDNQSIDLTPAKGGIGPITVGMLFEQLLAAAKL